MNCGGNPRPRTGLRCGLEVESMENTFRFTRRTRRTRRGPYDAKLSGRRVECCGVGFRESKKKKW
jgi:hypothetical protein